MNKPNKGSIRDWCKRRIGNYTIILGTFVDHPDFAGRKGHTSYVVNLTKEAETDNYVCETRNSVYTLLGEPKQ